LSYLFIHLFAQKTLDIEKTRKSPYIKKQDEGEMWIPGLPSCFCKPYAESKLSSNQANRGNRTMEIKTSQRTRGKKEN
jgi:hypothetical protein